MYKPFEKEHILIAHRGYSGLYPENTLLAFKKSMGKSDMFEFDVQFTKDKIPIVYHNKTINKKRIKNLTYNEIRNFEIEKEGFREKIPTLFEVIEFIKKEKVYANLEIKPSFLKKEAVFLIEEWIKEVKDYIIVSSFEHSYLEIDAYKAALFEDALPQDINSYIKNLKLDAIHVSKKLAQNINPFDIKVPVNVYTVNSKIEKFFKRGFKGVFSDFL
jgi:glycerophosphoryl diester phosphodiesterase